MPIFEIYNYSIGKKKGCPGLFDRTDAAGDAPSVHCDSPLGCFGGFFNTGGQIPFSILSHDEEGNSRYEPFGNEILRSEGDIVLMTLENNKVKHTTIDKKDIRHEHHPYCRIIIDNRPGRCYIAIERSPAFQNDPDRVASMMTEAFNSPNVLGQYRYGFAMEKMKKNKADFWDMVAEILRLFNDTVRQIRLDFNGKKGNGSPDPGGIFAILSQLSQKAGCDASLLLDSDDHEEGVRLEEIRGDIANLADICMRNPGYDLSVRFRRFGIFRFGAELYARFGIDEEMLERFEKRQPRQAVLFDDCGDDVTLPDWLDRTHSLLKEYKHEPLVTTKSNGRLRRRIL